MNTFEIKQTVVYLYDPLNRLAQTNSLQRFYNSTRIASEIEGSITRSFFEHDAQPLAQQQAGTSTLLAIDQQASVLHSVSTDQSAPHVYSLYGHRPVANGLLSVLGFNGERPDPITGHYLLGQGYRAFNPVLMRFNSPDSFSPFGEGGINAYAYCGGDPINYVDPTGHFPNIFRRSAGALANSKKPAIRLFAYHPHSVQKDVLFSLSLPQAIHPLPHAMLVNRGQLNTLLSYEIDDAAIITNFLKYHKKNKFLTSAQKKHLKINRAKLDHSTEQLLKHPLLSRSNSIPDPRHPPTYDQAMNYPKDMPPPSYAELWIPRHNDRSNHNEFREHVEKFFEQSITDRLIDIRNKNLLRR